MKSSSACKLPTAAKAVSVLYGALAALAFCACDSTDAGAASAGRVDISSPKAGQVYHVGDSLVVNWSLKEDGVMEFTGILVSLSPDSGAHWGALTSRGIAPSKNRFAWKIADSVYVQTLAQSLPLSGSSHCQILLQEYNHPEDPTMTGKSAMFTISP